MYFDHKTGNFTLSFTPSTNPAIFAQPTEVFTSTEFYYPNGAGWSVSPSGAVSVNYDKTSGLVLLTNEAGFAGTNVTITIYPL